MCQLPVVGRLGSTRFADFESSCCADWGSQDATRARTVGTPSKPADCFLVSSSRARHCMAQAARAVMILTCLRMDAEVRRAIPRELPLHLLSLRLASRYVSSQLSTASARRGSLILEALVARTGGARMRRVRVSWARRRGPQIASLCYLAELDIARRELSRQ